MSDPESIADRWARSARNLVDAAGSKTEQLARVGRLQLDLMGIRRDMQQEFRKLGERTRELIRQGEVVKIEEDPVASLILKRLDRLDTDRLRREADIEAVRSQSQEEERRD